MAASDGDDIFRSTAVGLEHDEATNPQQSTVGGANVPWARQSIQDILVVQHERRQLPNNVNVESVTEAVLKASPFVAGRSSGRLFWRHQLTSQEFQHLLTDGYWWFVAFDVQRLQHKAGQSTEDDPIFTRMAISFVALFQRTPSPLKDLFFGHFHEAMACGVLNCLIQAHPKERAKFDTDEFRRRLLDRCAVWTMGMRPHNVPPDHWLLRVSIQAGGQWIPPSNQNSKSLLLGVGSKAAGQRKNDIPEIHTVRCKHLMTNSPFFEEWMKSHALQLPGQLAVKVGLTQDRQRPVLFKPRLLTFGEVTGLPTGTALRDADDEPWKKFISAHSRAEIKERRDETATHSVLKRSLSRASTLMTDHAQSRAEARREVNEGYKAVRAKQRTLDNEAKATLSREDLREYTTFWIQGKNEAHKNKLKNAHRGSVP